MIYVNTFGTFCIRNNTETGEEICLREDDFHSPSLVRLLAYIVRNHTKAVSNVELIDNMWDEEEEMDNPAGVLKNQVYRLRQILKKLDGSKQFVITGKKAYYWNPEIPITLDTEEFDNCIESSRDKDSAGKIKYLEQAVTLCTDRFMKRHEELFWVISASAYYDTEYRNAVNELCELCYQQKKFLIMEKVAKQAIERDNLDEDFHYNYVRSLIGQGKMNLALESYRSAQHILYESLDIETADKLNELWPTLMETLQSKEKNIKKIQKELMEESINGAFFCEFGVFRKIYQLELRRADRMGMSVFMSLMSIGFVPLTEKDPETRNKMLLKAMDNMKDVLIKNLRSGDVISRYSKSQYIVLLPTCQYETASKVMKRIINAYNHRFANTDLRLEYSMDAIE